MRSPASARARPAGVPATAASSVAASLSAAAASRTSSSAGAVSCASRRSRSSSLPSAATRAPVAADCAAVRSQGCPVSASRQAVARSSSVDFRRPSSAGSVFWTSDNALSRALRACASLAAAKVRSSRPRTEASSSYRPEGLPKNASSSL